MLGCHLSPQGEGEGEGQGVVREGEGGHVRPGKVGEVTYSKGDKEGGWCAPWWETKQGIVSILKERR